MALQFTTGTTAPQELAPPFEFDLDDQPLTAQCPKSRMWSRLIASLSSAATMADEQYAIGSFMDACFGDSDRIYLERRYRDREDPLDDDTMAEIFEAVLEAWAPHMADEVEQIRETRGTRIQRRSVRTNTTAPSRKTARPRAARKTGASTPAGTGAE
ncbi:hypothetical protein RCO28_37955 [Streptomyces sp. LHD-70]|uniref:hypothetical protein n=1 Tax=Streptomyces sp. LHD-70 TaxID=3072140 RepID=UPI00280E993E|nr:hypothetical protein [Streptomyces sp. LHD-70]MDQ8708203.1 hypothetical protein [Streptomyces sp. LHD-70]